METVVLSSQGGKRQSRPKVMRSKSEQASRKHFVETLRMNGLAFLNAWEPHQSEPELAPVLFEDHIPTAPASAPLPIKS